MSKGTFGDCLKREREMREVSLEEICAATRIGTRFLDAMENEEWEKLPGGVFNRGFVRAVARYLGLDEETMLAEYDLAHLHHGSPVVVQSPQSIPRSFPKWLPVALVLLLAGLIFAGWYARRLIVSRHATASDSTLASRPHTISRVTLAPPVISPEIGETLASRPAPANSSSGNLASRSTASEAWLQLFIAAEKNTQLQVVGDGKTLFDTTIKAGENRHFQARDEFYVSAGDSDGVLLELNGQTIAPLGTPGSPGKILLTRKDLKKAKSGSD